MRRSVAALLLVVMASGCGTSMVVANDSRARIFVDGEMVGKGQGSVTMRGLPGSAQVLVKTEDGRRQQARMSRSFTATTFVLGLITYGICWVACWEYPGSLFVELPAPAAPAGAAELGAPGAADPWLQPPPGWQPRSPR